MRKYNVLWCRIWDFREDVESETEEEAYEKILEERKTAGSAIEIISVMPIDIEEVKEKGKRGTPEHVELSKKEIIALLKQKKEEDKVVAEHKVKEKK